MNILLWVLQIALAFMFVFGGTYKVLKGDTLKGYVPWLPRAGWSAVGILEVVGAVLLVVPAAVTGRPGLIPLVAAVLAVKTLAFAAYYGSRSLKLVAANPFVWDAPIGLVTAFVAIARYALSPLA